ncbi:MAG: hypothetical protein ACOYLB_14865 [Phototrophicaceae bacterium]
MIAHEQSKRIVCPNNDYRLVETTLEEAKAQYGDASPLYLSGVSAEKQPDDLTPSALVAYRAGMNAIKDKRWANAASAFQLALRQQPDLIEAHIYLAQLVTSPLKQGAHLNAALEFAPGNSVALKLTGELLMFGKIPTPAETNIKPSGGSTAEVPVVEEEFIFEEEVGEEGFAKRQPATLPINTKEPHIIPRRAVLRCNHCSGRFTVPQQSKFEHCPLCEHTQFSPLLINIPDEIELTAPYVVKGERLSEIVDYVVEELAKNQELGGTSASELPIERYAIYIPYWAFVIRSEKKQREKVIFIPATRRLPKQLSVYEPPDLSVARDFNPTILKKLPALIPDVPLEPALSDVQKRVQSAFVKTHADESEAEWGDDVTIRPRLYLVPVWLVNLILPNAIRTLLVNGVTGDVAMDR